jgi:hypothetical protein
MNLRGSRERRQVGRMTGHSICGSILTVQTPLVVDAKLTARPEVDVAESANGVPTVCATG